MSDNPTDKRTIRDFKQLEKLVARRNEIQSLQEKLETEYENLEERICVANAVHQLHGDIALDGVFPYRLTGHEVCVETVDTPIHREARIYRNVNSTPRDPRYGMHVEQDRNETFRGSGWTSYTQAKKAAMNWLLYGIMPGYNGVEGNK